MFFGLSVILIIVACFVYREYAAIRTARNIVGEQHRVLDDVEIANLKDQLPRDKWMQWDALVQQIKGVKGDRPMRVGHIVWAFDVMDGDGKINPDEIPSFAPPPDAEYRVSHDVGWPAFCSYMIAKTEGRLVEAYDALRRGAEAGSQVCGEAYAVAQIEGDIPGIAADPSAIAWLERAVERGRCRATLAHLLLEGKFVPQDVSRGMALLTSEATNPSSMVPLDLALIYERGLHGVAQDHDEAIRWVLRGPKTLPWTWKSRFSHSAKLASAHKILEEYAAASDYVQNQTPQEQYRFAKKLLG